MERREGYTQRMGWERESGERVREGANGEVWEGDVRESTTSRSRG